MVADAGSQAAFRLTPALDVLFPSLPAPQVMDCLSAADTEPGSGKMAEGPPRLSLVAHDALTPGVKG